MQGSVAILVDGSPFVTLGPAYFSTMFQSTDDYYARPLIATLTRILRYAAFFYGHFNARTLCGHFNVSSGNDTDYFISEHY